MDMPEIVILISADAEWQAVNNKLPGNSLKTSPFGNWFSYRYRIQSHEDILVIYFHGGWGKVAAAGSTQFAIGKWHPKLLINLGTCGGFTGKIEVGDILLVEKTIIYDIYEQMGDPEQHIQHYSTVIDNSWLQEPLPIPVIRSLLVSADRDLFTDEIRSLYEKYGAIAGDWESGAVAWIARQNQTRCMILRGVTDLVSEKAGEAYNGNVSLFYNNTEKIMDTLLTSLPGWLDKYVNSKSVF